MLRPVATLPLPKNTLKSLLMNGFLYVEDIEKSPEAASKFVNVDEVKRICVPPVTVSALDHWQAELLCERVTTCSKALDSLLNGGFHCGSVTELCGAQGTGKTQICFQLCVTAQLPRERGGLNGRVLFVDSRSSFSCKRLQGTEMGIRGLTTYIGSRSDYYLEPYELQNTYLVIDGWSLNSQLYCTAARSNCAFGGDYDQFSQTVSHFFEDLLRCQVTPVVLLDGGWENKKRATVYNRAREKLTAASTFGPSSRAKHFPLLIADLFKDVLVRLGIKFVMCPFEADDCIAAVAKILRAPVLSYDSDFYIYGVMYIPFNTLDPYVTKNKTGYVKRCRIYRIEKLLSRFQGLDASLLPLASILLGNDYIKRSVFKDFFSRLKLQKCKNQNEQQRRIQTTLNWLRNYSLDSAIAVILGNLPKDRREGVLQCIEVIINGYSNLTTYMLEPLGLSEEYTAAIKENQMRAFKFQGDVDKIDETNEPAVEDGEANEVEDDEDVEEEEEVDESADVLTEEKFAASLPEWFIKSHLAGDFPAYFVNMLTHGVCILPTQIEDFSQPSAHEISVPILSKIFSLLSSADHDESILELVIREGHQFVKRFIKVPRLSIPLADLRQVDLTERKKIIDGVLGIGDDLEGLPEDWRLYVAAIIFWIRQDVQPERTNTHLNCLLISMLLGIIDGKIGFRRSKKIFEKKFKSEIERIEAERRARKVSAEDDDQNRTVKELVDAVDKEDCVLAEQFFIFHSEVDDRLRSLPRRFSVDVVHAFAQFQSCLRHSMHLNALLGHPYVNPHIGQLFSGIILYNFYANFSKRSDAQSYIQVKLESAPSLFKVFLALNKLVRGILVNVAEDKRKCCKRRRNKAKRKDDTDDSEEYVTAESDAEIPEKDQHFFDPRNPFSLLAGR